MASFSKDVGRFLDTMPSLDTNCIVGLPPYARTPAAANEVLLSAMKLDPSARNPIPSSCSLWLGAKVMNVDEAISVVSNPNDKSSSTGGLMITPGSGFVDISEHEKRTKRTAHTKCSLVVYLEICRFQKSFLRNYNDLYG
jgi:hypothetical protein